MDNAVQTKLEKMKKVRKILLIVSVILSVAAFVTLILFNFMPVFNLTLKGSDKFGNGFDYPGWQAIYYGIGIQYIPGYYEFGFDIWTTLGMFVPLLAIIVCYVIYRKGKNRHKAICEYVMGASLIFGGVILLFCGEFAINVASSAGMAAFDKTYLYPAIAAGTFRLLAYPIITCAVCVLAGIFKIINGSFLLHQRSYGMKNAGRA